MPLRDLTRDEWPVVRDAGLACSMACAVDRRGFSADGFNNPALHPMLLRELEKAIPLPAGSSPR